MPTSSARPDDLDKFAKDSRAADRALDRPYKKIQGSYTDFVQGSKWGHLDASSLLKGFGDYLGWNELDAKWVSHIAGLFRAAGGSGNVSRLSDATIAASLAQAGLDIDRQSVTFDDPVAYGFPPTSGYADDPVNTASGNFVELELDLALSGLLGGLRFGRTYNSRSDRPGPFGAGWSSWATARLRAVPEGAEYEGPDGQRALFPRMGAGYGRVVGINALVEAAESGLTLSWFGGGRWEFDDAGLPLRTACGPGTEVRLRHEAGRLVELTHRGGKRIDVEWDGDRIVSATCSDGRRAVYGYDDAGHLVEVDRSGVVRRYEVDDEGRILTVTDPDGVVEVANVYDDEGRVVRQRSPFGRTTRFTYLPGRVTVTGDENDGPPNTYVHDVAGRVLTILDGDEQRTAFNYDQWGNPVVVTERSGAATIQEWDDRSRLVRRVLPTGARLTWAYDDADRVVEVAASNGSVTQMRYAGDERSPSEIVDPEGGVTRMTVEGGLIREIVDPDGVRVRFEFDVDGNVIATIDADGNVARTERDAAGRVVAAETPLGRRTRIAYDDRGLPVERRDPAGGAWRYEHTRGGRLTSVTDPTGARDETRYGEHGMPEETVDPLRHVTARRYDVFGNVAGFVASDGATWEYGYDALMRLTTIADATGATWQREYDVNGNLVGSLDPVGTHRTATVDQAGRVTAIGDGLTSSAFEFDDLGRAVAHVRPDGTEARCEYDLCGRRVAVHDPVGGVTRFEYSAGGKVLREIAPSGRVDALEYDRCGRMMARIDGAGRRWEYRYDADRAIVERVEPDGGQTRFDYDAAGRVVSVSQPGNGVTRYEHDAAGRTTAIADRRDGRRTFGYDAAGRLVAATDANGATTRYGYDERGRLTETVDPLGGSTTRTYDAAGRILSETDPLGRSATLTYDAAGRVVERTDGSGRSVTWSYDASGRTSAFGPTGGEAIAIERDDLGREVSIDEPGSFVNAMEWDRAGRLTERRRDDMAMRWRYTPDGERAAVSYPDGSETTYGYDAGGLLSAKQHAGLGAIALARDPAGRLVGATAEGMRARWRYDDGDLVEYHFEAAGRVRTAQLHRDGVGRVVEAIADGTAQRFAYDAAGQLLSAETPHCRFEFAYDANGRLAHERSPAGAENYEHDAAGQLVALRRDGGASLTAFEYDGAGRRTRQDSGELSRTWRWDDLGRLVEVRTVGRDGADPRSTGISIDALGELARIDDAPLMWDTAAVLAPLAWMDGKAVVGHGAPWALVENGAGRWLAPDWQGTPGEGAHDPWGQAIDTPGAGDLRLGYRGELEFERQTWLRDRVYDSSTRSFLTPDALVPVPAMASAANPYHYAANNPIGLSDPLGLHPLSDSQLATYRDQMDRNIWETAGDFVVENVDYIAAGALIVGGGALMITGVGGPLGVAMIGAGVDAGIQKFTTGGVDWGSVAVNGAIGLVSGGVGGRLATAIGSKIANPVVRNVVENGVEEMVSGMADRGLHGGNPFDPAGLRDSVLTGGVSPVPGGRLGADDGIHAAQGAVSDFTRAGDDFGRYAKRAPQLDGYHDVAIHGNPNYVSRTPGGGEKIDHRTLARMIRSDPAYDGGPIRLLSCSTGKGPGCFAQNLSNKMGVDVTAPDDTVWAHASGRLTIGDSPRVDTGSWQNFTPGGG